MSYRLNRSIGYQPWGVTNPWVWANYGQPQRLRGYVSPLVFQTQGPYLKSAHLGEMTPEEKGWAERMERYTVLGLVLSAASVALFSYSLWKSGMLRRNRRRRRSR